MNWYLAVLKKYATFSGRANRSEYWFFVLFNLIITIVLVSIDMAIGTYSETYGTGLIQGIYGLGVLLPSIAVAVRRLHDSGKSAWWLLILLVPLIGVIVFLIFLLLPGKAEANQYGKPIVGVQKGGTVIEKD